MPEEHIFYIRYSTRWTCPDSLASFMSLRITLHSHSTCLLIRCLPIHSGFIHSDSCNRLWEKQLPFPRFGYFSPVFPPCGGVCPRVFSLLFPPLFVFSFFAACMRRDTLRYRVTKSWQMCVMKISALALLLFLCCSPFRSLFSFFRHVLDSIGTVPSWRTRGCSTS
jgi:hypothetical protein